MAVTTSSSYGKSLDKPDESLTNTEAVTTINEDGTATVDFVEPEDEDTSLGRYDYESTSFYGNLVDELTDDQRQALAESVLSSVNDDDNARQDWLRTIEFGLDLLGTKVEEKNTPFAGACSAQHPLLMESAIKFQSKASNELLPANGPVKTKVLGDVSTERESQANRVKAHMNYQITEQMTEFYVDSERMLLYVPLVGSGFKKTYYNAYYERPCSEFIPADQFIVPNSASDLQRADRYTHVLYKTDYELEADCESGLYKKPEDGLAPPKEPKLTNVQRKTHELMGISVGLGEKNKVHTLYEHHAMLCIDGLKDSEGEYKIAKPYIVTIDEGSRVVLGIRRNWREDDPKRIKRVPFTHYQFVPSFNFYGFGYLHLLGNLQLSLTSALRSLVDAGQFANLQGGFKLKGVRIADDGAPIHPGQFKELETVIMDINKAIMPLPFKEPSSVLYQMLEFLDVKGQKFADSTEQVLADATNYGPVGTTMALLEASTKFFSAIHKRLHSSLKNELKLIAEINSETLPDDLEYNIENATMQVTRADYDSKVDVVPVSDPNMSSSAHRMAKAQTLYEFAMRAPELHDMREVLHHVYTNLDYANIDKILPKPQEAQPSDPMTDIQAAVGGKPIKAFPGQDHKAHIAIKQAFMQDPMSGANPIMQKASIAIQANVQEHMLLMFTEQVQAQASAAGQEGVSPEQALAIAAQQVAQMNQQNLQQQMEAAKNSDPAMILAKAELMDTEILAKKQAFSEKLETAKVALAEEELKLAKIKELNRAAEVKMKASADVQKIVTTKGMDAMIQGMSQSYQAKQNKDLEKQRSETQKEIAKQKKNDKSNPKPRE